MNSMRIHLGTVIETVALTNKHHGCYFFDDDPLDEEDEEVDDDAGV